MANDTLTADLIKALERLRRAPDLCLDSLEDETIAALDEADVVLRQCAEPAGECRHDYWVHTGTAYGGDDDSYRGEGRVYCSKCGEDGDG